MILLLDFFVLYIVFSNIAILIKEIVCARSQSYYLFNVVRLILLFFCDNPLVILNSWYFERMLFHILMLFLFLLSESLRLSSIRLEIIVRFLFAKILLSKTFAFLPIISPHSFSVYRYKLPDLIIIKQLIIQVNWQLVGLKIVGITIHFTNIIKK